MSYKLRIILEYFQPKIGRRIRIFSLGRKNNILIKKKSVFHFVHPMEKENITRLHKTLSVSAIRKSFKMFHKFFTHELTFQILTNQSIKIGHRA